MAKDVEIELSYDGSAVTITTEYGVHDYEMEGDVIDTVDFLIEHGAEYSVYSQEDEWLEELEEDPWTVI